MNTTTRLQIRTPSRSDAPTSATLLLPLLMALMGCGAAWAQTSGGGAPGTPAVAPVPAATATAAPTTATQATKAEAEVRRVDAANGRIQLRHGYIANLDMPPMTMVFRVAQPALLDGLKEGDRILFTAEKIDGAYTVTSVEKRP